ncbi:MAG: hypothetical protein AABN95_25905 [Acidobacteriota bacterium]
MSGAQQAVVTDFNEAWWEHVLEEAADELLGGDGATLELISGGVFVRESDLAIMEVAEAVVTEGHAKDVRGEILEGLGAGAYRFGVDHPVFAPDPGSDCGEQISLFQLIAELSAEDTGEGFHRNQKVFAGRAPAVEVREAAAGDDVMDMGMIEELAGPGVEHADHAEPGADEARVLGQLQ